jgi:hypothetical protein
MIGSYDPLDALFDFQRALESRLESDWLRGATTGTGAFPPINVFQQGENLVAIIELAGISTNPTWRSKPRTTPSVSPARRPSRIPRR